MSKSASNHSVTWEATKASGDGTVTELTGTIDYVDDVGVKTAVIDVS